MDTATARCVPDGDGPWPGVLVFPDASGAQETIRPMGNRLADIGHVALIPDIYHRGPEGAVRRGHLAHRRTTPLTGCPKAHNHGQNAPRVSHPNPPPPQQNHALATSRRKPASRANGLIYMALGRVRYPAKRLLQATETGSGRIRACMPVSSYDVTSSLITVGHRDTGVWLRRAVSAVAWRCCHLVCHWLQGAGFDRVRPPRNIQYATTRQD